MANPCQNGAVCTDSTDNLAVSPGQFSCACTSGYTNGDCAYTFIPQYAAQCAVAEGGRCDVDVNECDSNPCQNTATCSESTTAGISAGAYSCSCVAGFANGDCAYASIFQYNDLCAIAEGGNCDVDVNECVSSPCQNGAACTDSTRLHLIATDAFDCTCQPGYTSDAAGTCNLDVDECASSPCENSGDCFDSITTPSSIGADTYSCTCATGWGGVNCGDDINECFPNQCVNDAVCIDSNDDASISVGSFACQCLAGWANGVCSNGTLASYAAQCGTAGLCDLDINECSSTPCANSGACSDSSSSALVAVDHFFCTCTAGYSGEICDVDINDCASIPCTNGGVCTDGVDAFSCACAVGHTGTTCADAIDVCTRAEDDCADASQCLLLA